MAEDVHLQDLVADDVDPDEEHAVGEKLRPDELGHPEFLFADLHRHRLAAGMDVAPDVVLGADPAARRAFVSDAQRPDQKRTLLISMPYCASRMPSYAVTNK